MPFTDTRYTYHPAIYPVEDGTTEVVANNPLYDETPGNKITTDSGIKREEAGNPASKLTIKNTSVLDNSKDSFKTKLGTLGSSKVAEELLSPYSFCWLASRCVYASSWSAEFCLYILCGRGLEYYNLCYSNGEGISSIAHPFRIVVSVPGSRVNIEEDGTVTLKQANS